jgi:hypothetical protein
MRDKYIVRQCGTWAGERSVNEYNKDWKRQEKRIGVLSGKCIRSKVVKDFAYLYGLTPSVNIDKPKYRHKAQAH